jgi:hypothetical protein
MKKLTRQAKQIVPGTFLYYIGPAERPAGVKRQYSYGEYACTLCGVIIEARNTNVRPGHTVSCGCLGRELYVAYQDQQAIEVMPEVQRSIWNEVYSFEANKETYKMLAESAGKAPTSQEVYGAHRKTVAAKYGVPVSLMGFILRSHKENLLALYYRGLNQPDLTQFTAMENHMLYQWCWKQKSDYLNKYNPTILEKNDIPNFDYEVPEVAFDEIEETEEIMPEQARVIEPIQKPEELKINWIGKPPSDPSCGYYTLFSGGKKAPVSTEPGVEALFVGKKASDRTEPSHSANPSGEM